MTLLEAIQRSMSRTTKVLDAIESGDLKADSAIREMLAAQPWDLDHIGNAAVLDYIVAEETADGDLQS